MSLTRRSVICAHRRRRGRAGLERARWRARRRIACAPGRGAGAAWKHGLSLFGEPHYPAGFKHFDYVNPAAPQGGTVRQIAFGTFDNFNQVVSRREGQPRLGHRICSPNR